MGAYTNKKLIEQVGYEDWNPIAQQDSLSPCSRTSKSWSDKTWPIKPDIVMEGGNSAIDPATKKADSVDDLSLLTTKLSATGALFTTTGDTSGAAALASRFAARIWASYPTLWPETIRGLLIHSARWTSSMLQEFRICNVMIVCESTAMEYRISKRQCRVRTARQRKSLKESYGLLNWSVVDAKQRTCIYIRYLGPRKFSNRLVRQDDSRTCLA